MIVTVVEFISESDPRRRKLFDFDNSVFGARSSETEGRGARDVGAVARTLFLLDQYIALAREGYFNSERTLMRMFKSDWKRLMSQPRTVNLIQGTTRDITALETVRFGGVFLQWRLRAEQRSGVIAADGGNHSPCPPADRGNIRLLRQPNHRERHFLNTGLRFLTSAAGALKQSLTNGLGECVRVAPACCVSSCAAQRLLRFRVRVQDWRQQGQLHESGPGQFVFVRNDDHCSTSRVLRFVWTVPLYPVDVFILLAAVSLLCSNAPTRRVVWECLPVFVWYAACCRVLVLGVRALSRALPPPHDRFSLSSTWRWGRKRRS
jgi:hypothetical protein